jgi:predicted enzyme related to lactoylglutathione lyase
MHNPRRFGDSHFPAKWQEVPVGTLTGQQLVKIRLGRKFSNKTSALTRICRRLLTQVRAAFSFYQRLFGWEKTDAVDMGEMGVYQMYTRKGGDFPLGGIFAKPAEMPVSAWLYYAKVNDVQKSVEEVKKLGGQILNGPMEVSGGDFVAQCLDPQGAAFALHSTKP